MDNDNKRKEKGWHIDSWEEFRQALADMHSQRKLYRTIRAELKRRGNWKDAPRGAFPKEDKGNTHETRDDKGLPNP